jgi:hypothetical protein
MTGKEIPTTGVKDLKGTVFDISPDGTLFACAIED